MDALKEILEAMGTRVKSPILGSVLTSFIAVNWKVLFFVVFSKVKAVDKFEYFDAHTGLYSLFLIPLVFGVILAVATPWVSYGGMLLAKLPLEKRKKLQNASANEIMLDKLELEQSRKALLVTREETLIEQAKRDQNITQEIQDEGIKEKLQEEIDELRNELVSTNKIATTPSEIKPTIPTRMTRGEKFKVSRLRKALRENQVKLADAITSENWPLVDLIDDSINNIKTQIITIEKDRF